MDLGHLALEIALKAAPAWLGDATHTDATAQFTDKSLARAGESFAGGTLWAIDDETRSSFLFAVKSHNNVEVILEETVTPAITTYAISPLSFAHLRLLINSVLSSVKYMESEDVVIDTTNTPARYTLTEAIDVRRVMIEPTDTDVIPYRHHQWREEAENVLYFYDNIPEDAGNIQVWYPTTMTTLFDQADELPKGMRIPQVVNACLQAHYRSGIQKTGKDGPINYDLINEVKDQGDKILLQYLTAASSIWDYDTRTRAS